MRFGGALDETLYGFTMTRRLEVVSQRIIRRKVLIALLAFDSCRGRGGRTSRRGISSRLQ